MTKLYWEKSGHAADEPYHEIKRLKMFHDICSKNHREMYSFFMKTSEPSYVDQIFDNLRKNEIDELIEEFVRLFYNYMSSAIARKEIAISFINRHRNWISNEDLYKNKIQEIVAENKEVISFVEALRNIMLHSNVPKVFLCSSYSIDNGAFHGMTLSKDTIQKVMKRKLSGDKKAQALSYILNSEGKDKIFLSTPINMYENSMNGLYDWIIKWLKDEHRNFYPDYHKIVSQLGLE